MAWGTLRKATQSDYNVLNQKAKEFAERHNLDIEYSDVNGESYEFLDIAINFSENTAYLKQLWKRIIRRALNAPGADGIAYGYVGYYIS